MDEEIKVPIRTEDGWELVSFKEDEYKRIKIYDDHCTPENSIYDEDLFEEEDKEDNEHKRRIPNHWGRKLSFIGRPIAIYKEDVPDRGNYGFWTIYKTKGENFKYVFNHSPGDVDEPSSYIEKVRTQDELVNLIEELPSSNETAANRYWVCVNQAKKTLAKQLIEHGLKKEKFSKFLKRNTRAK